MYPVYTEWWLIYLSGSYSWPVPTMWTEHCMYYTQKTRYMCDIIQFIWWIFWKTKIFFLIVYCIFLIFSLQFFLFNDIIVYGNIVIDKRKVSCKEMAIKVHNTPKQLGNSTMILNGVITIKDVQYANKMVLNIAAKNITLSWIMIFTLFRHIL